jgi:hypothetical protein
MSIQHKTIIIFGLMMVVALSLSIWYSPQAKANRCITSSDYTDGSICECLYANGLRDSVYCH